LATAAGDGYVWLPALVKSSTATVYIVSALAVRKSEFESINSEKMTIVLSSAPMLWNPSRIAYADAPEKLFIERVRAANVIEIVVDLLRCGGARCAILEFKSTDLGLNAVRRCEAWRSFGLTVS
jgi:hypothetical protein